MMNYFCEMPDQGNCVNPFKCQPHKMIKHTKTICHHILGELFECVSPFSGLGA